MGKQKKANPEVKKTRETKTNHQTGWHKRVANPTTNYPKSTHAEFCRKCLSYNNGCPNTNTPYPDRHCTL